MNDVFNCAGCGYEWNKGYDCVTGHVLPRRCERCEEQECCAQCQFCERCQEEVEAEIERSESKKSNNP